MTRPPHVLPTRTYSMPQAARSTTIATMRSRPRRSSSSKAAGRRQSRSMTPSVPAAHDNGQDDLAARVAVARNVSGGTSRRRRRARGAAPAKGVGAHALAERADDALARGAAARTGRAAARARRPCAAAAAAPGSSTTRGRSLRAA